jgi:hypothetical protein
MHDYKNLGRRINEYHKERISSKEETPIAKTGMKINNKLFLIFIK